jgi:hypothetical protein
MKFSRLAVILMAAVFVLSACGSEPPEEAKATPAVSAPASAPAARASAPASAPATAKPVEPAAPKSTMVPAGTEISVFLIDAITTEKNKAGDEFMASLADPLVVNGKTVVARGTKVRGRVVDAEGSGRVKGRANIRLVLTGIVDGARTIPIVTKPFVAEAEGTKGRDAAVAGGGAGIGAAIGAATGGKKGAGIGALIGGAAGTGAVLATKGKEVEFDSETRLNFTLDKETELPAIGRPTS